MCTPWQNNINFGDLYVVNVGTNTYLSVVLYIKQQVCVGVCVDKTASNFCIHDLAYGYATRMRTAYYPQQQVSLVSTCDANICTWFASFVIAKGVHKRFQWTNAIADTASSFFFRFYWKLSFTSANHMVKWALSKLQFVQSAGTIQL